MASTFGSQSALGRAASRSVPPVWRGLALQAGAFTLVLLLVVVVSQFLPASVDPPLVRLLSLVLIALPVALWLAISAWPEARAAHPRKRIIGVAALSALTASAIGLPLAQDFFRISDWLPLESVFQRVIGYTLTTGALDAGLKFLVLRYLVFPGRLSARGDAIAYALAGAIGYSAFLNLAFVWRVQPNLDIAALYLLANYVNQLASSLFIALGMVESSFADAYPLVLPVNVIVAALVGGLISALLGGFLSGPLTTAGNTARPLFAFAMLVGALVLALGIVYFLYANSERREREAYASRRDSDGN